MHGRPIDDRATIQAYDKVLLIQYRCCVIIVSDVRGHIRVEFRAEN